MIALKEEYNSIPEIVEYSKNIDINEYISKDLPINLHFPCLFPTYAFFNDCYKQHLETELPELISLATSDSLANLFPHTPDGSLIPFGD
jgi:hypothetical protein